MHSSKVINFRLVAKFYNFFNFLSSNGYGNPLSFKDVGDYDINEVEMSMRNINPSFEFELGDKKLIKAVANHVKEVVDGNGKNTGLAYFTKSDVQETTIESVTEANPLLSMLLSTTERNSNREKNGYRYDPEMKLFAANLRMLAGPLAYETIQKNMPRALPALVSTNRYIHGSGCQITEGILRTEELRLYLDERSLAPVVCLSEDATRICGRVQYDTKSNQLLGFVAPLNKSNGLPIPFAFPARSAEQIFGHFSAGNSIATYMNVIMVQPVANVPAFCLIIFGSDNKYTTMTVVQRWQYIVEELRKAGISVLSISSDSDSKYNAAMRKLSKMGERTRFTWFSSGENIEWPFFIQDSTHLGTKLRNLLLSTVFSSRQVPFGKYFIRLSHLYELIAKFPKDRHQLTASTLNPIDRQNFKSVLRLCDPKVITLLRDHIKNSQGTVQYLHMMRDVLDSYMDPHLAPLQRIRKIWYPLFLMRIWRNFIKSRDEYTIKDNFISTNCYACIELNAHAMVKCLLYLKQIDRPAFFMPWLFDSQPCESIFRQFRSFTTTYSTVINSSLKEAMGRISKIQFQNHIVQATSSLFVYPRAKHASPPQIQITLPTEKQIFDEIEFCQKLAIATATKHGLIETSKHKKSIYSCDIKPFKPKATAKLPKQYTDQQPHNDIKLSVYKLKLKDLKNIQLKNYALNIVPDKLTETSPYVEIVLDNNKRIVVRKTSLCWLLGTESRKMSNDRLLRVQYSLTKPVKSKQKQKQIDFKPNKLGVRAHPLKSMKKKIIRRKGANIE